ncbi:MAG TPA: acylneuraminate cytidylyltransferase family protein [Planctomycetota bacterium]|nr:acylneuraminate cytidylyltransferase family protein [Planctomycetota bacterium]
MGGPVLGLIPARGGSKGIPGKNIRLLGGRPLLDYTARAARESGAIDRLVLSTDSEEIAAMGRSLGVEVPFIRLAGLAQDDTPMAPVVVDAVRRLEETGWSPEVIVLLQPTAPFRKPAWIAEAVAILRATSCDSVASVVEVPRHMSPDYVLRIADGKLVPFLPEGARVTRRQDARAAYSRDGSVYAFRRDVLLATGGIYGADCRPLLVPGRDSVNLDTPEDWATAERMLGDRGEGQAFPARLPTSPPSC